MFDRHFAVWPEGLPHQLKLPETSLYSNLEISALRYPDENAIIYYDAPITYRELKQQVDALAGELKHLGVEKGDRVMLFMQNAPQFIIGYYAILRANAIVVPINPMNRSAELEHYLQDTQASVCICSQEVFPHIEPLIGPDTVNTMPEQTLLAFLEHGAVADTLEEDVEGAEQLIEDIESAGVSMEQVTADLLADGV